MYQIINDMLYNFQVRPNITNIIATSIVIIVSIIIGMILRSLIRRVAEKVWPSNILAKRASNIIIPVIIYMMVQEMAEHHVFWSKSAEVSLVVVILFIIFSCIKSINIIYSSYEISKNFPINGILQVTKVTTCIISAIVIISIVIDMNPTVLLGSLGAMTAIITLIFKDVLLGFVAGIQLTTNRMIRIGDWIEVPDHLANGLVVDLSMTTVKVENFDKTLAEIPAYLLVTQSFINWSGVTDAGARRIKRPLHIDATCIRICNDEMIEKFKKNSLLTEYIDSRQKAGEQITNIGAFRTYTNEYLRNRTDIRQDLTLMVRLMEPLGSGIPLEIVAFTDVAVTLEYEKIQSDIFEHLYAIITDFDLSIYQTPSSSDIRQLTIANEL